MSLGLDKLKDEILEAAEKKKQEILDRANKRADDILSEAREKAEEVKNRNSSKTKTQGLISCKLECSKVRLQHKMEFQLKKQELIEETYEKGFRKLKEIVNSKEYDSYLNEFVIDGGKAVFGGNLTILVREQDKGKIDTKKCTTEIKAGTKQETSLTIQSLSKQTIGGCIVQKGKIWVDNTIEAIFDRKKRDLRIALAKILFEGGI